ncbi:procathepsin L-like [Cloeon dipterum]|uniref:procathepsin L-like n=1 Tax=Cloeon dipterum TaxID=197152 RepID=UPI00321F84DB
MKILILLSLLALGSCFNLEEEWKKFKARHQKTYETDFADSFRMKVFSHNAKRINSHNERFKNGSVSYKLELNQFADMLGFEFRSSRNGFNRTRNATARSKLLGATFISPHGVQLPDSKDWRTLGAVTPVKDQGHCGSCWSFSSTGALEGQHFRKTGKLVSLSEQNLIDCSTKYGNEGCNGGLMDQAFQYVKDNRGIDTEDWYPYDGQDEKCRYDASHSGATDAGFVDVESGNEDQLKEALATIGPVSVAIDASHESFQFYSQGVYYEPQCDSQQLDHGVLAVGYGTDEESGQDYWLIKNSWGTSWGDGGYVKIARNRDNNCGVATQASYPLV